MNIHRLINVFEKTGEKHIAEIDANRLQLSFIQTLFEAFEDDPFYYRPYEIAAEEYAKLVQLIPELSSYPDSDYALYLEAVNVG